MASQAWFVVQQSAGNGRAPLIGTDKVVGPVSSNSALYQTYLAYVQAGTAEGPYSTKAKADAALAKLGSGPHVNGPQITNQGVSIGNPFASLSKFFSALGQASTWTRVAEVLIGAALIIVGLARLGGNSQIVRTAGKVAATTGLA